MRNEPHWSFPCNGMSKRVKHILEAVSHWIGQSKTGFPQSKSFFQAPIEFLSRPFTATNFRIMRHWWYRKVLSGRHGQAGRTTEVIKFDADRPQSRDPPRGSTTSATWNDRIRGTVEVGCRRVSFYFRRKIECRSKKEDSRPLPLLQNSPQQTEPQFDLSAIPTRHVPVRPN